MPEPTAREAVERCFTLRDEYDDIPREYHVPRMNKNHEIVEQHEYIITRLERAEADWLYEFQRSLRAEAGLVAAEARIKELLEELRQRFPGRIALWPYKEGYYFELDGGDNCAVDWIPTFREAVVAGAEALLGVPSEA